MAIPASSIARQIGAELVGADCSLSHVAPLDMADADSLSFVADRRYLAHLADTHAGAVIVAEEHSSRSPCTALVVDNPHLAFARAAELLHPRRRQAAGVHGSAVVDACVVIDPSASIGPLCVIERDVRIGAGVEIGPACVVREGSVIGDGSRLVARVTICERSIIGERVLLHPGAVIGREGFGFAKDGERWARVPQLGRVRLGNDVEVGANSAVDRGALGDTLIADGVKIDSLIQIGHNVSIGENTAMAACSGISGSTRIGRNCTVAGAVGIAGHLDIGDDVHFTGMAMVTRSFPEAGVYSSGIPAMSNLDWRRNIARFRHLDELAGRVKRLEQQYQERDTSDPADGQG
jgi:UDP-3-O-[3-hydroxymyristoyl] glucosamine N-acyltransferase